MQKTIVQLVSDLSGDVVEDGQGETIEWSYRGVSYSIDLTSKEAAGFDKAVAMYQEHSTKVGGRKKSTAAKSSGEDLALVRAWAKENGFEVSERGRVAQTVKDAYAAAH